jgi:hypothetical protein
MREAITDRLRRALDATEQKSPELSQEFVGVGHLLPGILGAGHASDGASGAMRALQSSKRPDKGVD